MAFINAQPAVSIQEADFDLGLEITALRAADPGVGAVASFLGTVRQWTEAGDEGSAAAPSGADPAAPTLVLEHYPGMTERSIDAMVVQARERFGVRGIRVIHRVGPLALGDQIVMVAVAASHRRAAFECCEFLMDWLKTQAPFWKRECGPQGSRWVEAREEDDAALDRWAQPPTTGAKDPG